MSTQLFTPNQGGRDPPINLSSLNPNQLSGYLLKEESARVDCVSFAFPLYMVTCIVYAVCACVSRAVVRAVASHICRGFPRPGFDGANRRERRSDGATTCALNMYDDNCRIYSVFSHHSPCLLFVGYYLLFSNRDFLFATLLHRG